MWFLWDGDTFLLYSQPDAQKVRNVAANPKVSLHLNDDGDGGEVVTFEGEATVEPDTPRADRVGGYLGKYREAIAALGYEAGPFARTYSTPIRVRPTGSGPGSAMAVAPEIRELLDRMAASGRPPLPPVGGAGPGLPHPGRPGPERAGGAGGRRGRRDGARPGRGAAGAGLHPRGRRAVPDRGLVPRRRLGGRHPRHLRPAVPGPGRHGAGGGGVGRLPAGPEHRWPAAVEDAYAATLWASRNAAALGGAQHRLAVAGDSAGGNLAAAVALGARDRGGPQVAFQLLVYPVLDAAADTASWREHAEGFYLTAAGMRWYWDHYLGTAEGAPDASPLRAAFLGGLPPALVIGAEHDILRDEGEAYAARLRDAGVEATASRYAGMVHGFFRWRAVTGTADAALQEAAAALRTALAP